MIILLGTGANQLNLTRKIINWGEEKVRRVPRKIDVGSVKTTMVETDASSTRSRKIKLTCRLSLPQKVSLYALQAEHGWQPLTDDGVLIDYVWLERSRLRFMESRNWEVHEPWMAEISCVASNV